MTTPILGVDPGATGALAWLHPDGHLETVEDMPANDGIVSGALIAHHLDTHGHPTVAWIENVHSMPRQGVASSFKFGRALGTVEGALAALGIPIRHVTPTAWKKAARLPASKDAARRRAIELWPTHAHLFARAKDDGRAEAALIARHGLEVGS